MSSDEPKRFADYTAVDFGYECDLHFFDPKETVEVIDHFISQATQKGLTAIRLVHGRGMSKKKRPRLNI
jgi:DNA-nicking Smr family endonuclease